MKELQALLEALPPYSRPFALFAAAAAFFAFFYVYGWPWPPVVLKPLRERLQDYYNRDAPNHQYVIDGRGHEGRLTYTPKEHEERYAEWQRRVEACVNDERGSRVMRITVLAKTGNDQALALFRRLAYERAKGNTIKVYFVFPDKRFPPREPQNLITPIMNGRLQALVELRETRGGGDIDPKTLPVQVVRSVLYIYEDPDIVTERAGA